MRRHGVTLGLSDEAVQLRDLEAHRAICNLLGELGRRNFDVLFYAAPKKATEAAQVTHLQLMLGFTGHRSHRTCASTIPFWVRFFGAQPTAAEAQVETAANTLTGHRLQLWQLGQGRRRNRQKDRETEGRTGPGKTTDGCQPSPTSQIRCPPRPTAVANIPHTLRGEAPWLAAQRSVPRGRLRRRRRRGAQISRRPEEPSHPSADGRRSLRRASHDCRDAPATAFGVHEQATDAGIGQL